MTKEIDPAASPAHAAIGWLTVTVDRTGPDGRPFQSLIHIGPDGWSQSGEDLGDTRDLAEALFDAAADILNADDLDA